MNDLMMRLDSASNMLPKQQRLLCDYVKNNLVEASMLTISQLAERANVGTATVMRTVQSLGYDRYTHFKEDLKKLAVSQAGTSYSSYANFKQRQLNDYSGSTRNLSQMLNACNDVVKKLSEPAALNQISQAVNLILQAKRIFLVGLRSSYPVAQVFETLLLQSDLQLIHLSVQPEYLYERLSEITPEDVLVAIAARPVAKRTVDTLRICHAEGIPSVVITNTKEASVCQLATKFISAESFSLPVQMIPLVIIVEIMAREIIQSTTANKPNKEHLGERLIEKYKLLLWDDGVLL